MSTTFTEKLKEKYKIACEKNKGQTKYYYCASSSSNDMIPRSLDLENKNVFCNKEHENSEPKEKEKGKDKLEYKLAAFLIKKALENENWLLPIKGKKWKLLDAERNFAEDVSGKGKGKRLDILAYEEETKSYIILELKINRAFAKANKELECYTDTINNLIKEANKVYGVEAENVKGYIVWNEPKENRREIKNRWGIIEYDIDVLKSENDVEKLEFSIITEPNFMKITIHRGTDQIGGCITEIATETTKIFIDLGHNLPKGDKPAEDKNANKEAIEKLTKGCNAIFYTHYHGDHVDLYKYVPETIPQYIGEIAKQVMICKSKILAKLPEKTHVTEKDVEKLKIFKTFKAKDKIKIGDITVTPYFVSHSACDSYMFLIESNEKSVLHTGDFREHGYLGKGLIPTLETYIAKRGIDVLITEGTMLSRLQEKVKHENDLKIEAIELLKKYKYSFVLCSSTDIDRLASFHEVSKEFKRSFLCDKYQKEMLEIFSQTAGEKSQLYSFDSALDFQENDNLFKNKNGFILVVRSKHFDFIKKVLKCIPSEETLLIYSMWDGYINKKVKNGDNLVQGYLDIWNLFENKQKIHTSGHATAETLANVCKLVNPKTAIIPIHSEHSGDIFKLDIPDLLKEKIITPRLQHRRFAYAESQFKEKTGLKEGAKVRYIGANDKQLEYWNNKYSDPRGILDLETIYEIKSIVIGRSYTIVKLVGFQEEKFNGVIFKAVDIDKPLNKPEIKNFN